MRVMAVRNADEKNVYIYGYGEYIGDKPCPLLDRIDNPCIKLDNGDIIWGCQCWWRRCRKNEK